MITQKDIKKAVSKKEWDVEDKLVNDFGHDQERKVGFSTGRGVWYWFTYRTNSQYVMFDQRYSQNNGQISRSFKQGLKAEEMILAALDNSYERIWS